MQAYALQTYLETIGVNAEIVDYRSAYLEKAYRGHSLANKDIKKLLRDLSDWPIRYLKIKHLKIQKAIFEFEQNLLRK